jgi:ribonucleoside-diphosphate reductase alpha chain
MKLSDNARKIAEARYFMGGEDWQSCVRRVAAVVAGAENSQSIEYTEKFSEIMYDMDFLPGGRILRNAGRPRGSMFNCYVLPIGDSREEIGQYYKDTLILWGEGGGIGVNISPLRPQGDPIKGVGGQSSGPVSFLEASDGIAKTIESGGSRRAAALACMNVSHPDILDFIDAKLVHGKLSHFNISVAVTEDFLEAVESNNDWEFKFAHKSYDKIKARKIWDKIIENMVKCAEPGLLNWNNLIKNNSYYYDPPIATNPCGEAILSPYDVCDLGSLVLPNFITGTINTNWKKLEETIKLAVRFLDDVIEVNKYVLKEIDIKAHNSRRIGLGIMGLSEYLFAKGLKYGSDKSVVEIERLMRFIRDVIYESLVELAIEKGAFPKFDPVAYGKASFIRKLPASLRMSIKEHGVRCVTGMAIAPTGTISLLPEVSSGIEPLFLKAYKRNDRISERMYVHPIYKDILQNNKEIPEWYVDTKDLEPADHFEIQAVVQRYTDGAVSKTINMPADTTFKNLSKLTLEYIRDLKGVTVYVDKSREDQVLSSVSLDEVNEYLKNNQGDQNNINEASFETVKCSNNVCDI